MIKFSELPVSSRIVRAVRDMGFETATEIQEKAIPLILQGKDVLGRSNTGTGKTAAFGIPAIEAAQPLQRHPGALILCPTRELVLQVTNELRKFAKYKEGIRVTPVYGGEPIDYQIQQLKKGSAIVVGTPGRILDHIRRGSLKLEDLKFMVLDEADEMLDMGFIDDIEQVLRAVPEKKRMLMFSATMPPAIMKLAESFMKNAEIIRTQKKESATLSADQIYYEVRESDKLEALTRIIDKENDFYGVVFCRTKLQCDEIGGKLRDRGYDAASLHGDLSQREREQILKKMKDHQISILVATDVAARGLDIQDLTHVINYSIPQDPEIYIHRVGRTGRAGKNGTAITFITPSEARKFSFIRKASRAEIRKEEIPRAEDIIEGKKARIASQIEEALQEEPKDDYLDIARKVLMGRDPESAFACLLGYFYRNELDITQYRKIEAIVPKAKKERARKGEKAPKALEEEGTTRLFIARGRKDGLTKGMLMNIIIEQSGVRDEDLSDIEVHDDCSFVSAPYSIAERILKSYEERTVKGKPIVTRAKADRKAEPKRKASGKRDALKGRKRRKDWEDDFQPYGRDTRPGEDGRLSFPERKKGAKGGRRRRR